MRQHTLQSPHPRGGPLARAMKRLLPILILGLASLPATAQTINTVAGTGDPTYSGDGGPATAAGFNLPWDVAPIPGGGFYFSALGQVRKVDAAGVISTVAGNGTAGFSGDGGPATAATLYAPVSIFLATDGSLYLSEYGVNHNRIRKIAPDGTISTISTLQYPTDALLDAQGNLYIVQSAGCKVYKMDTSGIMSTVAGAGCSSGGSGDGGPATAATFDLPDGARFGPDGALYVSDFGADRIRRIDLQSGIISTVAGSVGIDGPRHFDFDAAGNLYVAAETGNKVHRITPEGMASVIAGGNCCAIGDGGPATDAWLNSPYSVRVASGRLYIADKVHRRIREVLMDVEPMEPLPVEPETTCASEGYTGTKLSWCRNICENGYTGATLRIWIHRWISRYRDLPYCAIE